MNFTRRETTVPAPDSIGSATLVGLERGPTADRRARLEAVTVRAPVLPASPRPPERS